MEWQGKGKSVKLNIFSDIEKENWQANPELGHWNVRNQKTAKGEPTYTLCV